MQRRRSDLIIRFWRDECGMLGGGDYILIVTILCVGAVAGLATVRDGIVQDFGDVATALECISQSYTVDVTFGNGVVKQFGYQDTFLVDDPPGEAPHGIEICDPPSGGESN